MVKQKEIAVNIDKFIWKAPASWKTITLDDEFIDVKTGFPCAKKKAVNDGILHIRPYNIGSNGVLDLTTEIRIPFDFKNNSQDYSLKKNDILFNNTNSVELVGKAAIVTENILCTYSNHISRIRIKKDDIICADWLILSLRYLWQKGLFRKSCKKWIGQAGFGSDWLRQIEIPVPDLQTQQSIINRLSSYLSETQEIRKILVDSHKDARTCLQSVIDEVFTAKRSAHTGWEKNQIKNICKKPQYGYTPSATEESKGPKYLRITDIQNGCVDWASVPYCSIDKEKEKRYLLEKGDLLFARTGATTGKTFLIQDCPRAVFASYLVRLKAKEVVLPEFLSWFFQSSLYWSQVIPRGAAQPNMNAQLLSAIFLSYPKEKDEQLRIIEYLNDTKSEVDNITDNVMKDIGYIDQVEQSIIENAFLGEI